MQDNILKYTGRIWDTADILLANGFKKSTWPSYMMPFYALVLLEGRMLNKKDTLTAKLKAEGLSESEIKEEIKIDLEDRYYNKLVMEDEITLNSICKNDTNFIIDFENYLSAYDDNTKKLLGIEKYDDEPYLDLISKKKEIQAKGNSVLFNYMKIWGDINIRAYNNSEVTTLEEHIKNKWADISADTSGEHYTPWDIIELITDLIVAEVSKHKNKINLEKYIKIYDPTCGGGNMLFGVEDTLKQQIKKQIGKEVLTQTYGQEINTELYALSKIESMFRDESNISLGDTLKKDMFNDKTFDIIVSNVPYGVDWKPIVKDIKNDKSGRYEFLPSTSDGQLLFLQHILAKHKVKPQNIESAANKVLEDMGFNFSVNVTNGSPLFSGDAGSSESNIRKKFLDNENILAWIQLPKNEFFNTDISTYLWLMTTNKLEKKREGKVQLIDASSKEFFEVMAKSKGKKRHQITKDGRKKIIDAYLDFDKCDEEYNKIFDKEFFYFNKQSILLHHKDVNGKSIKDILPVKTVKGIDTKAKSLPLSEVISIVSIDKSKSITIDDTGIITDVKDFEGIEGETLKERVKRLQDYVKSIENEDLVIDTKDHHYYYDKEEESIKSSWNGKFDNLGNGIFKVSISYKKATTKQEESITVKVELLPKTEKDSEVISFQELKQGKIVKNSIDNYLSQWIEKDFDKLDNTVGVEINFNKIFYKYEKLRNIDSIVSDITSLEKEELELDKDIFDFSPIDSSELDIKK